MCMQCNAPDTGLVRAEDSAFSINPLTLPFGPISDRYGERVVVSPLHY